MSLPPVLATLPPTTPISTLRLPIPPSLPPIQTSPRPLNLYISPSYPTTSTSHTNPLPAPIPLSHPLPSTHPPLHPFTPPPNTHPPSTPSTPLTPLKPPHPLTPFSDTYLLTPTLKPPPPPLLQKPRKNPTLPNLFSLPTPHSPPLYFRNRR